MESPVPGISIVQSIHVVGEEAIDRAIEVAPLVDAVVLDSAHRSAPIRWQEQHGLTHDWQISRRIVEAHDGSIEIGSRSQRGTRVVVRLPAAVSGN